MICARVNARALIWWVGIRNVRWRCCGDVVEGGDIRFFLDWMGERKKKKGKAGMMMMTGKAGVKSRRGKKGGWRKKMKRSEAKRLQFFFPEDLSWR